MVQVHWQSAPALTSLCPGVCMEQPFTVSPAAPASIERTVNASETEGQILESEQPFVGWSSL